MSSQNISWHPETAPDGPISPALAGNIDIAKPIDVRGGTVETHTPTKLAQKRLTN